MVNFPRVQLLAAHASLLFFLLILTSMTEPTSADPTGGGNGNLAMCFHDCNVDYFTCALVTGVEGTMATVTAMACSTAQSICTGRCTADFIARTLYTRIFM
mmetsp:Transcript_23680/g.58054  ORF Transcript_23680/g.58054 Transcript_23680/m.58054 type:complete len:101 (+) Transcript_23680:412-714(+)